MLELDTIYCGVLLALCSHSLFLHTKEGDNVKWAMLIISIVVLIVLLLFNYGAPKNDPKE